MRWRSTLVALAVVATGCTIGDPAPAPTPAARLADGTALPECEPGAPAPEQTVTFVAEDHAWALDPAGDEPTCLFDVSDPGPFLWGPQADRVLLDGLEVKATPGAPGRDGGEPNAGIAAWGHPTGRSIVYVSEDRESLLKVHPSTAPPEDVTPLAGSTYLSVIYHPSGLAIAFAVERSASHSIWMSSNTGHQAKRLVFTTTGTRFGALAFLPGGGDMVYGAVEADGTPLLSAVSLRERGRLTPLWVGSRPGEQVLGIAPGRGLRNTAFTVGASCRDSRAMLTSNVGLDGHRLMPRQSRPTHALGWLGPNSALVALGGCDGPFDLVEVDTTDLAPTTLVTGVAQGAVRVPAPTPPPELPEEDLPGDTGVG